MCADKFRVETKVAAYDRLFSDWQCELVINSAIRDRLLHLECAASSIVDLSSSGKGTKANNKQISMPKNSERSELFDQRRTETGHGKRFYNKG